MVFVAVADRARLEQEVPGLDAVRPARRLIDVGADDHPANRQLAVLFLAGVGAEVSEAVDGEDAVEIASHRPFDVILMDVRMPKLEGPGALRRIRALHGPNADTPVLAFTADADADAASQFLAMGFQDVVAKPIDATALIAAMVRVTAPGAMNSNAQVGVG